MTIRRRDFLSGASGALAGLAASAARADAPVPEFPRTADRQDARTFNGPYRNEGLSHIAFPMGGMGAGMICLEGHGALSKFSLRNRPDLTSEPRMFAAVSIKGSFTQARVLEGPVPARKISAANPNWMQGVCWGLPRYREAVFDARFPFATVRLEDESMPLSVELTGWSPFIPGDANSASLPVAGIEYRFVNTSSARVEAMFSFNTENFMASASELFALATPRSLIRSTRDGFILYGPGEADHPWDAGYCAIWVGEPSARVNRAWFKGAWLEVISALRKVWADIEAGWYTEHDPPEAAYSPGASLFAPMVLSPGETRCITLRLAWYIPQSNLFQPASARVGDHRASLAPVAGTYQPWYAGRFSSIDEVCEYWNRQYASLRKATAAFTQTFYSCTLPAEIIEAVGAHLVILKSPTLLRQTDGRLWGWEGSDPENGGGGYGTSTHVWNYAQAIAHLFPELERGLRETELTLNQNAAGHQYCRAALPLRSLDREAEFAPVPDAADGQLGGILKAYREWRISGDTEWLRRQWEHIRASMDYCIRTWDPRRRGWIEEPHLTTFDMDFWGPNSFTTSLYLGALKAMTVMAVALNESSGDYAKLLHLGVYRLEHELFNGEYFFQRTEWRRLQAAFPPLDSLNYWSHRAASGARRKASGSPSAKGRWVNTGWDAWRQG